MYSKSLTQGDCSRMSAGSGNWTSAPVLDHCDSQVQLTTPRPLRLTWKIIKVYSKRITFVQIINSFSAAEKHRFFFCFFVFWLVDSQCLRKSTGRLRPHRSITDCCYATRETASVGSCKKWLEGFWEWLHLFIICSLIVDNFGNFVRCEWLCFESV